MTERPLKRPGDRIKPKRRTKRTRPGAARPTSDDFKAESVARAVRDQALQHPLTIFPAAAAVVSGLAAALFESPGLALATLGLGLLSGGLFIYNWLIRGEDRARDHIAALRSLRDEYKALAIEDLIDECERAGYEEGLKESRELKAAYDSLIANMERVNHHDSSLALTRFKALAEDSLEEGVSCLRTATRLRQTLAAFDLEPLLRERQGWQTSLESLESGNPEAESLQKNIDTVTRRIDQYKQSQDRLNQLIVEQNEIETALISASLEIVDLASTDANEVFRSGGAAARLEGAVATARRVEERMRDFDRIDDGISQELLDASD